MKVEPFIPTAPEHPKWDGGYGSGEICPGKLALELFGEEMPGPWLACYMLRRFGWPNAGSDDHKEFMSWTLTTPIEGLYLAVSPYLAGWPERMNPKWLMELSLGVRYTERVGQKMNARPGVDAFHQRKGKAVMRWWKTKGIKLYAWGIGKKEGDEDELVHLWSAHPKDKTLVGGLWRRTKTVKGKRGLPKQLQMVEWWLAKLIEKHHPEVRLPKWKNCFGKRGNPFQRKCERALKKTILDLLRPTYVRDLNFNCFGRTDDGKTCAKKPKPEVRKAPEGIKSYWPGVGYTPAYWYSKDAAKERKASSRQQRPT